jgi:hypothetical protein
MKALQHRTAYRPYFMVAVYWNQPHKDSKGNISIGIHPQDLHQSFMLFVVLLQFYA